MHIFLSFFLERHTKGGQLELGVFLSTGFLGSLLWLLVGGVG